MSENSLFEFGNSPTLPAYSHTHKLYDFPFQLIMFVVNDVKSVFVFFGKAIVSIFPHFPPFYVEAYLYRVFTQPLNFAICKKLLT